MSGVDVGVTVVLILTGLGLWLLYGGLRYREMRDGVASVIHDEALNEAREAVAATYGHREEACGADDGDEGACILELGHDGEHWYSWFGTPRA